MICINKFKLHPNSRIDARLQICDANLFALSGGLKLSSMATLPALSLTLYTT